MEKDIDKFRSELENSSCFFLFFFGKMTASYPIFRAELTDLNWFLQDASQTSLFQDIHFPSSLHFAGYQHLPIAI